MLALMDARFCARLAKTKRQIRLVYASMLVGLAECLPMGILQVRAANKRPMPASLPVSCFACAAALPQLVRLPSDFSLTVSGPAGPFFLEVWQSGHDKPDFADHNMGDAGMRFGPSMRVLLDRLSSRGRA